MQNKFFYDEPDAVSQLASAILYLLPTSTHTPVAIVCIGTDRSTGDSLGPLVGTMLEQKGSLPFYVYGTLKDPIHAVNLEDKLKDIQQKHKHAFIIAVDACLGRVKNIGMISIEKGPLKPGAAVNKNLPSVGDAHITGIVNVSGFMEFFVLQNTRLHLVMNMAEMIATGIYEAGMQLKKQNRFASLKINELKYKLSE
ncbi:spore protease YyaC [Anoxybacillus ayderensis]|uniref:spore protease YyaC n=1 Tax=Anoxybacillus sp. ST70 TaxID=2864180 RepID=UPI0002F90ADA|nr:spore protease YyaC [Anoxybacillus sp. ST70]AXM88898.1 spore protease YyaC [Anoxybacillus ayderensis G10]MBW9218910.1 spore protease YyaC [Anoxybacillus sp. ST70]THD15980.1 spore protease YyaC [Anoxybacillus ayderensis]